MPPRRIAATAATVTPPSGKTHKRSLSSSAAVSTPGTRSSKRLKDTVNDKSTTSKATPKKSKYFEEQDDSEEDDDLSIHEAESGYEDDDVTATEASEVESESEESFSDEDIKPKRKPGRKPQVAKVKSSDDTAQASGKDLWREGVKTGLGPGKQVFIAKPKPRDDGGIKYVPEKIHPNTMAFLSDLKKNNDREWLKRHDPDYRQSWKDWESFVEALTEKIINVDETIPELPPKDLVFRIYRDVRFSSDPTPYKPHFSAAWSRTGRKGPYAAYYVQIQPGGRSFVGGGLWHPEAQPVALLRRNIDRRPERLRTVLVHDSIRKHLFDGIPKDEKKAIKKFCDQNAENALKTKPKGYEADHPNIDLLRLKNFTMGRRLMDTEVLGDGALGKIAELIKALYPFITYLNSIIMPDDGSDNDSDDDDNDE